MVSGKSNSFQKILISILLLILAAQLVIFVQIPLTQNQNDSAQYYMNVHYAWTGTFIVEDLYPNFTMPNQLYPFFGYSMVLYFAKSISAFSNINWASLVATMQFIFYVLSCFLVIKISNKLYTSKILPIVTGILFVLYYPNFNFANLVMSENYAICVLLLCVYLFIKTVENYRARRAAILYLICGHLVLIKPVFALIIIFFILYHVIHVLKKEKKFRGLIIFFPVVLFPLMQIGFSMKYYNNMKLRSGFGWNLWNRVIASDKLIPQNSEAFTNLKNIFEKHNESVPLGNWWDLTIRLAHFGYTQEETIEICRAVAWDGIKENPGRFILNTFKNSYNNFHYGLVNRDIYCSTAEYKKAITDFGYDRNHGPLVTELLKQSFEENSFKSKINNWNCKLAELSLKFYFLYHNIVVIFIFLITGIIYFFKFLKNITGKKAVMHFMVWWSGITIIIGSNLTEYPQSRLILPSVIFVVLVVMCALENIYKRFS